jgi:hypothetical protein
LKTGTLIMTERVLVNGSGPGGDGFGDPGKGSVGNFGEVYRDEIT